MKRYLIVGFLVVGLLTLAMVPCTSAKDMKGTFFIGGNLGYALTDMEGPNDWFGFLADPDNYGWIESSSIDELGGGLTYGGELGYFVTSKVGVGMKLALLSREGNVTVIDGSDDEHIVEDKVSATIIGAGGKFVVLDPPSVLGTVGGGLLYGSVDYEENVTEPGETWERKGEGTGLGFYVDGGVLFFLSEMMALDLNLMYSALKLSEIENKGDGWGLSDEGEPLKVYYGDFDLKDLEIDLGGLAFLVSLHFYF